MKLYLRLAWDSMRKNRRLYLPFLMTCAMCVCIFCILSVLAASPSVASMPGGETLGMVLGLGCGVMGVFSVLFLFYTNSFLIRRRKREFGLYNVLGMDKHGIARVLFWETVLTAFFAIPVGLIFGGTLSHFGELILARISGMEKAISFSLSATPLMVTAVLYAVIFFLLFLNGVRQVRFASAAELLRSESAGEKPPKGNLFAALLGAVLLGIAYGMAVCIQEPLTALLLFFAAVILVILATYLLMISGSVTLCGLLQKNRNYYCQPKHFVSVSSMRWRMKRNGAGLASICILATMVLVMLSSTSCLYFGAEDSLNAQFPRDVMMRRTGTAADTEEIRENVRMKAAETAERRGLSAENVLDYRMAGISGLLGADGTLKIDPSVEEQGNMLIYENLVMVYFIPAEDFNRVCGTELKPEKGTALAYAYRTSLRSDTVDINGTRLRIVGKFSAQDAGSSMLSTTNAIPILYLVISDFDETLAPLAELRNEYDKPMLTVEWTYGFDLSGTAEEKKVYVTECAEACKGTGCVWYEKEEQRADYFGTFGGFFFLGVLLSAVFLVAASLIIYYKQLCEGYEDCGRFGILMKVGMDKDMIRASVNSQLRTVFFFPLILSVAHLCFAFPMLRKLLLLFNVGNLRLLILTAALSVLGFALFYVAVYRFTAGAYYRIVGEQNR